MLQSSRQTIVTLMQPSSLIQQTPIITTPTTLFNSHEQAGIGTSIGTVPSNNPQQQQLTATNNIQATFPGTGQMVLTAAAPGGTQQAQQYVVQNVVTPVSFVQSKFFGVERSYKSLFHICRKVYINS